ncbi:MAG: tetratricopeptide repeat protein, partial [Deinococcales bacterium]
GIASAVGFAFSGATKTEVQLQNHLRAKEMLLFLDNFEQLTEHSSWLEGLLTNAPKLKIVVTSRLVLGLGSEWLFDLTGLSYPAIETKQPLESFEAVQLFLGQTARRSSRFTADQNTLGLIGDLTRQVQGLPLALEIVAAWTRSLGVEELLRGLLVQFETLLESDHEDVFARHRNLKTILESAWSLLSPNEQSVLVGLSVFSGSFSVAAAASIAKAHLGVLLHLQNLALIQRTLDGRFELHELVKQFVIPLEPKNYQACLEQKQKFFTTYLEQQNQNLRSSITPDTLRQCRLEVVNIVDVLEQNNGLFSDQAMLGFLAFVEMLGLFELGIACTQKILAQPHLALPTLGQCLALRANFGVKLGLDDLALQSAQACLEIGHNDLNWVFRGVAFYTLGIVQHFAANYPQALLEYHKALEVFAANYSHSEMARTHNRIAVIYSNLNQPQLSNSHYETALEMAKTANDLSEIGLIYNNYGINFESVGDIQKATALYTQALEICQSIGYLRGSSAALTNLGHLSERAGDYLSAKKYYEQSIIQKKEIGEPIALAISNTNLADVLYHLQMPQQANALNLQTLQSTLNANAYMYAARVVWSFCKHFRQQGQTLAAQTLAVFLLGIDCEEWVHEEASTLLAKQESKAIDQSKLEFSSLLDWLDTHLKM